MGGGIRGAPRNWLVEQWKRWREAGRGKGGPPGRGEALVRTGDERQNLEVAREEQPPPLGLLLRSEMGS